MHCRARSTAEGSPYNCRRAAVARIRSSIGAQHSGHRHALPPRRRAGPDDGGAREGGRPLQSDLEFHAEGRRRGGVLGVRGARDGDALLWRVVRAARRRRQPASSLGEDSGDELASSLAPRFIGATTLGPPPQGARGVRRSASNSARRSSARQEDEPQTAASREAERRGSKSSRRISRAQRSWRVEQVTEKTMAGARAGAWIRGDGDGVVDARLEDGLSVFCYIDYRRLGPERGVRQRTPGRHNDGRHMINCNSASTKTSARGRARRLRQAWKGRSPLPGRLTVDVSAVAAVHSPITGDSAGSTAIV